MKQTKIIKQLSRNIVTGISKTSEYQFMPSKEVENLLDS
jgi:hypothetical protein